MFLLTFPDSEPLAGRLAEALQLPSATVDVHHFPDGESRVRLPSSLPDRVLICRTLCDPNHRLVELMLAARCARDGGARHLTLVAPYLCYMRQDRAFEPGEAVSQRIVGDFLAGHFDALVTADPHLHRVHNLGDAVPARKAKAVSAAPAIGKFLATRLDRVFLLGPDAESRQWVSVAGEHSGFAYGVATKTRHGDRDVSVHLPDRQWQGTHVVLVDDVAASGGTLATATRALKARGAERVDVVVTHALFAGDAIDLMRDAGIGEIWSSDSIPHWSNAFSLAPALAGACREDPAVGD
jgi:ribose-phosphate pyrophosphokinase